MTGSMFPVDRLAKMVSNEVRRHGSWVHLSTECGQRNPGTFLKKLYIMRAVTQSLPCSSSTSHHSLRSTFVGIHRLYLLKANQLNLRITGGLTGTGWTSPLCCLFEDLECTQHAPPTSASLIPHVVTRSNDIAQSTTASTKTFVTALVLNGIIVIAEITVFTIARRYFRFIYEPRSLSVFESCACHLVSSCLDLMFVLCRKRQPPLSPRLFGWVLDVWNADYRKIKDINGLDSYFFIRFLRMMVRVMLPIWLLSWILLLPLDAIASTAPSHTGLDKFIFGNIGVTEQTRYAGHLIVTWIFTGAFRG
jgi:Late exocytosis, associated with Golgi transport